MSTPGKEIAEVSTKNALAMRDTLREQTEIAGLLRDYIHVNMREGIDFGVIPGTKNPTLLQPGAERLAGLFRCIPTYKLTHRVEDYQEGIFQYDWSCELVSQDTGQVVATGIGSATSFESKWRYRNEARKCPACGKEAIIKGKAEYGGGWVCFKKKDGCGAKFADDDQAVVGQKVGRVENENPADLINTIQKIGKKRSGVDASAALARRYGYTFDVDMEDVKANDAARGGESNGHEHAQPRSRRPSPPTPSSASSPAWPPATPSGTTSSGASGSATTRAPGPRPRTPNWPTSPRSLACASSSCCWLSSSGEFRRKPRMNRRNDWRFLSMGRRLRRLPRRSNRSTAPGKRRKTRVGCPPFSAVRSPQLC